jgi:poly[(R)-3-hydroxyalkanoate] polymerase subunit PhaC
VRFFSTVISARDRDRFHTRSTPPLLDAAFRGADRLRRHHGEILDTLGFRPVTAPRRVIFSLPGMRLRDYGGPVDAPAFVIIAAPFKRAYIWDLAPEASVIRRLSQRGFHPFLIEWAECREQPSFGLADYADRLPLAAIAVVARHTGSRRVILAGHSLGGTLAALFAALHPSCVAALVLLEAPTAFAQGGAFAPLVAALPTASLSNLVGLLPGSLLDAASVTASPVSFIVARWLDGLASAADPRASLNHLRVVRWTLDEFPMSAIFLGEVVDQLYREDRFMRGTLSIAGREANPAALAMPVLNVMRPESLVIPPEMIRLFHEKIPSQNKRLLRYDGEIGVALRHVGVLVGPHAHRELWPEILEWAKGAARPSQSNSDDASRLRKYASFVKSRPGTSATNALDTRKSGLHSTSGRNTDMP